MSIHLKYRFPYQHLFNIHVKSAFFVGLFNKFRPSLEVLTEEHPVAFSTKLRLADPQLDLQIFEPFLADVGLLGKLLFRVNEVGWE